MTETITVFSACQIQEKQPRKGFRVCNSEAYETSSGVPKDSTIEVQDYPLEDSPEVKDDSISFFERSMKRKSYHNPFTNAEIVIDKSKVLFQTFSIQAQSVQNLNLKLKNEFENS